MKFCHVTIYVKNLEESLLFYQEVIGLEVHRRFPIPSGEIVFLGNGNTEIELIYDSSVEEHHFGKDISLGFEVECIEKAIALLRDNHFSDKGEEVRLNPNVRFFFCLDPNGVKVQFVEYTK